MSSVMDSSLPKTQDERDLVLYESRLNRPVRLKTPEFQRGERLRHVIFSGQFSVELLEELPCIDGQALHVPTLSFSVNRIKCK